MKPMDKAMLWGAWVVIAATVSLSIWKTEQRPLVDPGITRLENDFDRLWSTGPRFPGPGPVPTGRLGFVEPVAVPVPIPMDAGHLRTRLVERPENYPTTEVFILSLPVPGEAKSTLDGTTITWSLTEPKAELKYWMRRKEARPTGYIIKRQAEDGRIEEIDRVGPKATSYVDLTPQPRMTYRYWVVATGSESDLATRPPVLAPVVKGLDASAKTRTPAATRMKLIGGDKANAFLRSEVYSRAEKKWVGRTVMVVPGRKVDGWTLNGLRFDNFTLVADVTDDEGVDRVLTTKD